MGEASQSDKELQDGLFGLICTKPDVMLDPDIGETDCASL